jgi:ketosteroid isomerase-like protein
MSITYTETANAAVVRRVYEAFNPFDLEALTGLLSPDVSFLQPGRSTVSGLYEGRDAVFGWFGALAAATGGTFRPELLDLYPNDTQVVAVNRATGTAGDTTLSADAALVFEVSNGVVTAVTVHQQHQEEWDEFFV